MATSDLSSLLMSSVDVVQTGRELFTARCGYTFEDYSISSRAERAAEFEWAANRPSVLERCVGPTRPRSPLAPPSIRGWLGGGMGVDVGEGAHLPGTCGRRRRTRRGTTSSTPPARTCRPS
eukprot:5236582-Pyramimonas_sp.AAC.1